jgi:CDP-glucose 4,6-dehydratase
MLKTWGAPDHPVRVDADTLHEAQTLRLDISKSLSRLNWRPRLSTPETLAWTAEWYRAFHVDDASAEALAIDQIDAYERRARAAAAGT